MKRKTIFIDISKDDNNENETQIKKKIFLSKETEFLENFFDQLEKNKILIDKNHGQKNFDNN